MRGVVLQFPTDAREREQRLARLRAAPSDFVVLAAVCCWPIALTWFAAQAMVEALTSASGSRS